MNYTYDPSKLVGHLAAEFARFGTLTRKQIEEMHAYGPAAPVQNAINIERAISNASTQARARVLMSKKPSLRELGERFAGVPELSGRTAREPSRTRKASKSE